MDVLYKPDVVDHLCQECGFTVKDASHAVEEILNYISDNVATGHEVQLTGFGKFGTRTRPASTRKVFKDVRNIPAKTLVTFKAGKRFRDAVESA